MDIRPNNYIKRTIKKLNICYNLVIIFIYWLLDFLDPQVVQQMGARAAHHRSDVP